MRQVAKSFLVLALLLFVVMPARAQGTILFFPLILKGSDMAILKSTIGITSPLGVQNYVLNPSGEIAANFSNQSGGTVTRVTTFQKYGLYSYQVATTGAGHGGNFTMLALSNNPNYITFRVKMSNVRLNITIGSATREAQFLEKIDSEWRLFGALFTASQTSGQTNLRITQIGTGTNTFYLDGLQAEPSSNGRYTTYVDGTQEGCRWLGAPHASASTRSADSRAGGTVKSFWEGYGFFPEKALGMGTAVEELNIDSFAFLPGGELNSSKIPPREFSLIGYFLGDTVEELHEQAQALELELGLDTYPGRQPVRLRYFGAAVQKEIAARYAGGLEGELPIFYNDDNSVEDDKWVINRKFKMRASIQFVATDPFWYEVGESATLLDTNDSATFQTVAARGLDSPVWSALGPPNAAGTYVDVRAIVEDDTYVYLGGNFLNFDNIANADYIVRRNKQTGAYSALGTGMQSDVHSLALGPDGALYAGGGFTSAGGVANTLRIARWNGTAWTSLGTGANGTVFALAFGPTGLLYAGGSFTTMNGVAANRIASYNGSTWSALSTGLGGAVFALAIDPRTGLVYIGHAATGGISTWDGSSIAVLGGGMDNAVRALAIAPNGLVYAGGQFTTAGTVSAAHIAAWNGTAWQALGDGTNNTVYSLAVGRDGILYLSGEFTEAGGITLADRIARWNGYSYSHLDIDLPGSPIAFAIYPSRIDVDSIITQNYTLYLGFNTTGTGTFAGDVDIQNDGTISAFPKIVFSRSGGTTAVIQSLRNERTGRQLLFDYGLLSGESLTVDLNPRNRTITSSFFGSRMDARLKNDDFSVWQLIPGENQVSAFISESGSPTVAGYVIFRTPYRSWN